MAKTIPLDQTTRDTASKEGIILAEVRRDKEAFYSVLGMRKTEQIIRFEYQILGFDLGMEPSLQQKNLELNQYLRSLIIPGLCFPFVSIWGIVITLSELYRIRYSINQSKTSAMATLAAIILPYSAFPFFLPLGAGLAYLIVVAFNAAESILFFILMNPAKVVPEQSRGL